MASRRRPITTGEASTIEREPAWSADGNKLAFAADRGEGFDIFVVALKNGIAAGAPVAVTTMAGDERWPSWTADGRLVFAHRGVKPEGRPADPSLQFDLFLLSPVAGSDAWQAPLPLTETTDSETYPRVSPDGTKVAFISERDSEDDVDLWWMPVPSAAIAKPIPLGARPPKPVSSSVPAVGDNGRPLRAIRMTRVRGHESYPSWAPDNTRVAFYAVREGIGSVWVATAEPPRPEGAEEPLPRAKPAAQPQLVSRKGGAPAWSPDGKTLLVSGLPDPQPVYNGNPLRNEVGSAAAVRAEFGLPVVARGRAAAGARGRRRRARRGRRVAGALRRDVRSRVDHLEVAVLLGRRHRRPVGERAREISLARHRREERSRSRDGDRRDGRGAAARSSRSSRRTARWWSRDIRWRRKPAGWPSKKAATSSTR